MNETKLLTVTHLSCVRGERILFSNLNFTLGFGEALHVIGKNGAGKSSLLLILCNLLTPKAGEIYWCGKHIHSALYDYRDDLVYIGHKTAVKTSLTVLENLKWFASLSNNPPKTRFHYNQILQNLGIDEFKNTLCHQLSAGQRQRLALARLQVTSAKLWILDEPFTAIDQIGLQYIQNFMKEHLQKGGSVILTSHQPWAFAGAKVQQLELR